MVVELDMHRVPAGTVVLRDGRSKMSRQVVLQSFELARVPITQDQFQALVDLPGTAQRRDPRPVHGLSWIQAVRWCNAASAAHGLVPAYHLEGLQVSWNVAAEGYRLPTEAEWERACRAGTSTPIYGPLPQIAWSAEDAVEGPQPVGVKAANAWGFHDMIGNVWEWCWDYADTARYYDYRVLRGGGWADASWSCRASVRRGSAPNAVLEDVGFRVARGPAGPPGGQAGQGWSAAADRSRADVRGLLPMGWTPLRTLLE